MAPHNDMRFLYAQNMEHFACGFAMYQPVSSADMQPPCVGYLNSNLEWNLVAKMESAGSQTPSAGAPYEPLSQEPRKMEQINIEWRPRTSRGVRQYNFGADGGTPNIGLPAGADAQIKYKSETDFGAVLIAQKPITYTSYSDEALFLEWIEANRPRLAAQHGPQLRRYGLKIITSTYATPGCSINTWLDKDKEATMSLKVKANMIGDIGGDLDIVDKVSDKDWSHYGGRHKGDTVVIFFNGITIPAWTWFWPSIKATMGRSLSVRAKREGSRSPSRSSSRSRSREVSRRSPESSRTALDEQGSIAHPPALDPGPAQMDLLTPERRPRRPRPTSAQGPSRGRPASMAIETQSRNLSAPPRRLKPADYDTGSPLDPDSRDCPQPFRYSLATTAVSPFSSDSDEDSSEDSSPVVIYSPTSIPLRRKHSSPALRVVNY